MAEEAPFDPEGTGLLQGDPDVNAQLQPKQRIASAEDYEKVAHGASYLDPEGKQRFKPIRNKQDWMAVDEGAEYADPEGNIRIKPRYEGIDFTAQTLYDMSVNDKERRKALERSYPGKVQEDPSGGFFVEDDGTLRKPGRGISKVTGAVASAAAPTILSVLGALGGGAAGAGGGAVAGSVVPVAGTVAGGISGGTAGAAAGGAGGAVLGQTFNDLIMGLSGTYDRTRGEEAAELGIAAAGGMMGAGVGRGISTVVPSLKSGLSAATAAAPGVARSFLGAGEQDIKMASSLAEKGVAVPPSAWAKEAPHLQNVVEVFDPAFHTNQPLLESATAHYEKSAGEILQALGVKDPGSLTKPIADVPTKEAGEAVMRRTLGELAESDAKLQAALDAKKAELTGGANLPPEWKLDVRDRGAPLNSTGQPMAASPRYSMKVGPFEIEIAPDTFDAYGKPKSNEYFIERIERNRSDPSGKGYGPEVYKKVAQFLSEKGYKLRPGAGPPLDYSPGGRSIKKRLEAQGAIDADGTVRVGGKTEQAVAQRETVLAAAEEARTAAQKLIDAGYKDIENDIKIGMKVAEAGHNSGDLWGAVGNKLVAVRRAVGERATVMYDAADQAAGGHLPNIEGLPHQAEQFLEQLPPDFQNRYPAIVKNLRDLAGVKDPKTGEWIKEPASPTFGQLHNMRSQMRANINYSDLTPDIREGTYKFFAGKVDDILHKELREVEALEKARVTAAKEESRSGLKLALQGTTEEQDGKAFTYVAHDEKGNPVLWAEFMIDGKKARLGDINLLDQGVKNPHLANRFVAAEDAKNTLGPGALRSILRQFKALHPEVESIQADRVSGARTGGVYDVLKGQEVDISIKGFSKAKGWGQIASAADIDERMKALSQAGRMLDEADAFYAENIKLFNANQVKAVMRGLEAGEPADPQALYNVVVKSGQTDLTNAIKEKVGPNLWAGVKAADMTAMLDASKTLVPDVIDGKAFARQVLDRVRNNTLEVVHGKEASEKLIEQARRIEMLDGRLPIPVRPGDTVTQVIARARQAEELAKAEAKRDPLATLSKEMRKIEVEGKREAAKLASERRKDPLGFLYNPTTGAAEAVDKILGSEDMILAAAVRFGETSPEFEMLRQVWAQRLLTGGMRPGQELARISPEVQQIMFPGVTLEQARTLAKEMDFLLDTRSGSRGTAQGMAAMAKVEHPWGTMAGSRNPLTLALKGVGSIVPGSSAAARSALGAYYGTMRKLMTSPALLRWLEKGLSGSPSDREAVRQSIAAVLQKGGAVGAGAGEATVQGSGPQ